MDRIIYSLQRTWRTQGWVRFESLLNAETVSRLPVWVDALCGASNHQCVRRLHDYKRTDGESVFGRSERSLEDHAQLRELITSSALPVVASGLLSGCAVLCKDKSGYKQTDTIGRAPCVDANPGAVAKLAVTCLVAIDPMTRENGCLEFAKASVERTRIKGRDGDVQMAMATNWEPVTLPAGGVLFFNPGMPYRRRLNRTRQSSRVLYLTYKDVCDSDQRNPCQGKQWERSQSNRGTCGSLRMNAIANIQGRAVSTDARP